MTRDPNLCPHRRPLADGTSSGATSCGLVLQILGASPPETATTTDDLCKRCCESPLPTTAQVNSVIASLAYQAARQVADNPGASWLDRQEAIRTQLYALEQLEVLEAQPDVAPGPRVRRWAVGVTIGGEGLAATEASLARAGLPAPRRFAEEAGGMLTALFALLTSEPTAEILLVVRAGVEVAAGFREWFDAQPWPLGAGWVTLTTSVSRVGDGPGWHRVAADLDRPIELDAVILRADHARAFLTDGRLFELRAAGAGAGEILAEWASRRGLPIACHTPALARLPTADGDRRSVRHVGAIGAWRAPERVRIGLVGWNTATGLGHINRDLVAQLDIDRWLVPRHPRFPRLPPPPTAARVEEAPLDLGGNAIRGWLRGLDWVLFAEQPYFAELPRVARAMGVRTACIPMWEFADLSSDWMRLCDLLICPTRFAYERFVDWKARFGFRWRAEHVPWPVDVSRFPFRPRSRCERFLFVNGAGGLRGRRPDGEETPYRRKQGALVLEAARQLPEARFLVYSQVGPDAPVPANVEWRPPPADNARLYDEGDVCVQPSAWEGIGLPLLECQAAGLPLVATDAPPMNEYRPLRAISARTAEIVSVSSGSHIITSHVIDPDDLAAALRPLIDADVSGASRAARAFVEEERSWATARPIFMQLFAY